MSVQAQFVLGELPPLELSLRQEAWLGTASDTTSSSGAITDVIAATRAALESPLDFPPLSQAIVPGDQVAIAIGAGVREQANVVRGIVATLEQAGTEPSAIQIVTGSVAEANTLRGELDDLTAGGSVVVGHVASDDESLCFLAAVDEEPLVISRQLFEADLVIPVGCGRPAKSRDARGPFESVFPRFADALTQRRYSQADALDAPTSGAIRRQETDQVGWLLGAAMVVEVVPARGGGVAQILAGAPEAVAREVAAACDREWACGVEQPARLVVATLAGGPDEQTWDNVARALHAAGMAADADESSVAICTQLDTLPGETLHKLIATGGDLERAARLHSSQSDDAAAAWEIYKALCRGPVYFMSQLPPELVEDLGMTPIASAKELARLAERSETCIVLNEAQHSVPKL
ncbi:lactate racemase domain-containing protein [Aeoliella sp. SH292]|uniref:lactate racemase domain-containing protein n=1 Tax=Aeoliella sp. SH292 TaxID=3454464 RepID=UPI003F9CD804